MMDFLKNTKNMSWEEKQKTLYYLMSEVAYNKSNTYRQDELKYFLSQLSEKEANQINMLALAHLGDAVYELLVRSMLCREKNAPVMQLHRLTVERVRAEAQAEAVQKLLPLLQEDELAVYKRGRNTKVNSAPHHADIAQYHAATGLEALFGWLYLTGKTSRIEELFTAITEE